MRKESLNCRFFAKESVLAKWKWVVHKRVFSFWKGGIGGGQEEEKAAPNFVRGGGYPCGGGERSDKAAPAPPSA